MPHFKPIVDPVVTGDWPERIGKLILNFSAVEFESVHWLVQLSEDADRIPAFARKPFTERVDLLNPYIEKRAPDKAWRDAALAVWAEASRLAKLRNRIAHNPLFFGWTNEPPTGGADLIGLPDMSRPEAPAGSAGSLMSKAELSAAINEIPPLVLRMAKLREEFCVYRDAERA